MAAADPIRKKEDVEKMANYWLRKGSHRNHLLVYFGVCSALRISDLLPLTWDSVYDFAARKFKSHIAVKEKKTGKQRLIAVSSFLCGVLKGCLAGLKEVKPADCIFCGRDKAAPISRVRAWSIIKEAANAVGVAGNISCHSLRKTFGYHAWKRQIPVAVIMEIFNHSSFAVTRRYLGIGQEELDRAQAKVLRGVLRHKKKQPSTQKAVSRRFIINQ